MSDVDALRDRLIAERLTAQTAEILAAVARVEYYNRQYNASARTVDALTCPPALAALTPAALADWAPRTLLEVRGEVVSRLADSLLAAPDPGPLAAWPPPGDWPPALLDALDPARGARAVFALAVAWLNGEAPGAVGVAWLMVRVHAAWCTAPKPPLHPLAPLVDAWQQRPQAESMVDDDRPRIMPRAVAHIENNAESYYLARFGPAVHRDAGGQLLMGFAEEGERGPTLPANVWTMGLAEAEKRGAVVPLALRIWIAAVLHTPMHARHGNYPILLNQSDGSALTLRRFLRWVYPSRPPKPNEYWPRILRAREVINATELPYADARGNLWGRQVVRLDTPYTRPGLDDPWPTIVHLPPGDGTGARVAFERLQYWWTRDAAATRALINLAYRWHIEGKRMMPAPGGNHWLQLRDPHLYDRLTDADIDALCFPPGTGIRRRDMRIAEGRRVLDKLVREGDAEWRDGRLLPPPPRGSTLA